MSDPSKELVLSPTLSDRTASPSADSRANGSHTPEESEPIPFPVSPKSIGSSVPATRDVKKVEPKGPLPTSETVPLGPLPTSKTLLTSETVPSGPLPTSKTGALPVTKTTVEGDEESKMPSSAVASDSDIHVPEITVQEATPSPLSEVSSDDYDTASEDSLSPEFENLCSLVEDAIDNTSLVEVLEKIQNKIKTTHPVPEVHDSDLEEDEYMYEIDSKGKSKKKEKKEEEKKKKEEEFNPALMKLHHMCWRILNNGRLICANQRTLSARNVPDRTVYKFERILQRISLIDEDLQDIYINTLPTLMELSYIENLASLIQHLTATGDVTVVAKQVINEVNCDRIMSHYNGFASFRQEDTESMLHWQTRLDQIFKERWTELYPYVSVYYVETIPLDDTLNKWGEVKMAMEELETWRKGMLELVFAAQKLIYYLIPLLKDIRETVRGYYCIQKTLRNNLITFLNMDISNMFVVKKPKPTTTTYEREYLLDS